MKTELLQKLKALLPFLHREEVDHKTMSFDFFVRNYWDRFVSHLSEFHPLEHSFVEKYGDELHWNSISKNTRIVWTLEFIRRYEGRFRWVELAMNNSIIWNSEWIEEFKERLDWHYLRLNKSLPLSEEFIEKYGSRFSIEDDNSYLTDELRAKYKEKIYPARKAHAVPGIEPIHLENMRKTMDAYKYYDNQRVLYEGYITPHLAHADLPALFESHFDYSQRYYYVTPVHHDRQGLTPEFRVKGESPFYNRDWNSELDVFDVKEVVEFINGNLQEGRPRLYEMPRLSTGNFSYPMLLVSENIKSYLETLKLPPHRFHRIDLHPDKLNTSNVFYLFHVSKDVLTKDMDYERVVFRLSMRKKSEPAAIPDGYQKIKKRIHNAVELNTYRRTLYDQLREESATRLDLDIIPDEYLLTSDYDLYTYSVHHYFIIPEAIKKKLELLFPGQMEFKSAQSLHIRMDETKYIAKAAIPIHAGLSLKPFKATLSEEEVFLYQKMDRLENTPAILPSSWSTPDEFNIMELQLTVRFPDAFKDYYRKGEIHHDYTLLPISGFYLSNEYAMSSPNSYRAVLIAENGIGDSLGLILERDSDFQLQPVIYEFLHETGEVEKWTEI